MARILVVDDEPAIRDCVSTALRKRGYETFVAGNIADAFTLASEHVPELIISDVCMEGGDGITFLKNIRSDPRTGAIPFIIISGHPNQETMMEGFEMAADGYLSKPLSLQLLLGAVENRLKREELVRRDASEIKAQLFRVLHAAPDLIALIDPETLNVHFLNPAGKRMLEKPDESLEPITKWFSAAAAENLRRHSISVAMKAGQWRGESVLVSPSGKRVPVELVLQSHRRQDAKVEYFSLIARDLTERNDSERALRASEYRFRCLVDALPDGVLMYDKQGQINFCNARAVELLKRSPDELLRTEVSKIFEGLPPYDVRKQTSQVEKGSQQINIVRKGAEALPASVYRERLEIEGDVLELCIFQDLTERKRLAREREEFEIQLRQSQKLESIGQLAAGIAHEINTPTQYIGDNTRFLKDAFAGVLKMIALYEKLAQAAAAGAVPEALLKDIETERGNLDVEYLMQEIPTALGQSLEGIDRVAKIVGAMKDFSHPSGAEKSSIDINHAIESTLTVARNEWKYVAHLETNFDKSLPPVPCLPGEFNQVILNLVVNAAHAIADVIKGSDKKGRIRVSTAKIGDWAEVRIADSGTGIPKEVQPRIFEPFFTTKEVGKGTGQGLAISRSVIVEKHGGTIVFETEKDKGTTFILRIPLAA